MSIMAVTMFLLGPAGYSSGFTYGTFCCPLSELYAEMLREMDLAGATS